MRPDGILYIRHEVDKQEPAAKAIIRAYYLAKAAGFVGDIGSFVFKQALKSIAQNA